MFAYRLVSGHWRVQTGVAQIGEEGTVTSAGVLGLNVVARWEKRRPEWVDMAWLAMRVHVGRRRKGGVHLIDVEGEDDAPPPHLLGPEAERPPPPRGHRARPPPPRKPRVRPPRRSGRSGWSRHRAGAEGGGAQVG